MTLCESERRHVGRTQYLLMSRNAITDTVYVVQRYWREPGDQNGRLYLAGDYQRALADCRARQEAGDYACHVQKVTA
jgi:hypothetical protein